VFSVAFGARPDGSPLLASGGQDGTVRLWDPITGQPTRAPLTGHTDWVMAVAFGTDPTGTIILASASVDRTVRLWDPVTGQLVRTLRRRRPASTVACNATGVAIGDDEGITVLDLTTATTGA